MVSTSGRKVLAVPDLIPRVESLAIHRGERRRRRGGGEDAFSAAARNLRPMETPYLVLDHGSRTRAPLSRR